MSLRHICLIYLDIFTNLSYHESANIKEAHMQLSPREHNIYIGMGGWELEPFNKYFYPPHPKKDFRKLRYYSQFFDSIEVNATFYNTSFTSAHTRRWLDDVAANKNFMFTVKLYRGFTHTFNAKKRDLLSIYEMLDPLAGLGKLGGLIVQFPYSFTNLPERREYLRQLSKIFNQYTLFMEVRHKSWNNPMMHNFFQDIELHLVNVDLPPLKQHVPLTTLAWDGAAYFRMMGRNVRTWNNPWRMEEDGRHMVSDRYHYYYSQHELEHLLSMIEKVFGISQSTFVVFHNDPEANSLINGFQLKHLVNQKQRVPIPQNFIRSFPKLKQISASVTRNDLLFSPIDTEFGTGDLIREQ